MSDFPVTHNYIERPRYFCSFGGALSTLEAMPDTIPVLHAAAGCAGSIAWGQNGGSGLQVGGYCGGLAVPSSNVGEREVIFGGAERLTEQIRATLDMMDGRLFVVITSCVTEIIGDDIQAVVSDIREDLRTGKIQKNADIVFAKTGGFKGNSYYGYDIVMSAIVRQFADASSPVKKNSVNVLGIVPYMDSFWRGNLEGIRKSLELLGLTVNTYFTADDCLSAIRESSGAELTLVVSDVYGLETARVYKELYDIPYIVSSLPVGPTATARLLRETAQALNLKIDVEKIIEEQNRRYYQALEPLVDCYHDADLQRYAVIIGDANYAVSATRFLLDDLGWIPELVQFTEALSDTQRESIAKKLSTADIQPRLVFDTNASEAGHYLSERYPRRENDLYTETLSPAFVIGSSLDRDLALKLGAPHLSLSFPVANRAVINRGYTGFGGGLTLTEDLLSAIVAGR
ncbi:MAG: hypothetical protein LBQ57_05110 [Spirochaetales bacterium]|jgi:nitrogenase molybdenum-iron protein beta chain|nr:hypothetical protein [Spirochaetales bacterium]